MARGRAGERPWLRALGLFGLVLALAVAGPLVLVGIPFALLAVFAPGRRIGGALLGTAILAFALAGDPTEGLWYLERGWGIVLGGWFLAMTLVWPREWFLQRGLVSVAGGAAWCGLMLGFGSGWERTEALVRERIDEGAASTLELLGAASGTTNGPGTAFAETVRRTAEIQALLFPALLALASIAALGVAWWLHVRLATESRNGLSPLRSFRFPDPMIWVLIGGLALVLLGGWTEGWGRVGANLAVFMGGLYVLRGAGVLLHRVGRVTLPGAVLVGLAALLAPPLVLAGAMALGVGDSWFDLRARGGPRDEPGED